MSSFLKPELAADGAAPASTPIPVTVTPPSPAHVPSSADVAALVEAAHEHIERLVNAELAGIQQTLAAAWRSCEESLAQSRAELADLRKQHEALKALYADAEKKVAVLDDVKRKLAGL